MRNSASLPFVVSSAIALAGCSIHGDSPGVLPQSLETSGFVRPDVGQAGHGAQWRQFNERTFGQVLVGMTVGPDGNIWYLDENGGGLVRVGLSGAIKEFAVNGIIANSGYGMVVGADKKFYVTYQSTKIAQINTRGVGTAFAIPSGDTTALGGVAVRTATSGPPKRIMWVR